MQRRNSEFNFYINGLKLWKATPSFHNPYLFFFFCSSSHLKILRDSKGKCPLIRDLWRYKYLAVCVDHKSGAQTKVASHFSAVSHSLSPDPAGKLTHSCNQSSIYNFHDVTVQKDDSNLFHCRLPAIK